MQSIRTTECEPRAATKFILLGNTGVGKSFLCNVLLQRECFASKVSGASVTAQVEVEELRDVDHPLVVYNIPGLIEVAQANIQRNKACIKQAFEAQPHLQTMVLFIMSQNGGRLSGQDVAACEAVFDYLKLEASKRKAAIGVVVNKVAADEFDNGRDEFEQYQAMMTRMVRQVCDVDHVFFAEQIKASDRKDFTSGPMRHLRETLLSAVRRLMPTRIVPARDAEIELDREKQVQVLQSELSAVTARLTAEMQAQSAKHQAALAEVHRDHRATRQRLEDTEMELRDVKRSSAAAEQKNGDLERQVRELGRQAQRSAETPRRVVIMRHPDDEEFCLPTQYIDPFAQMHQGFGMHTGVHFPVGVRRRYM